LIDTQEVHRVKRKQHKEEPEKPSDESGRTIATVNQDDLEDTLIFAFLTSAVSNKGKRQKKGRIERAWPKAVQWLGRNHSSNPA
jgi:hypothetical protein